MAARPDNLQRPILTNLSGPTGEGVVIDIGTGDCRFVSTAAKENPNKFYIGVDANVKPLEKPSMRATRKPSKGGLPNALFVQAAVEDLPDEFTHVADEIHIHFPWGSLLRAVATGDQRVLETLRRISAHKCLLEIVIGIDPEKDKTEIERLCLPDLSEAYLTDDLIPKYTAVLFEHLDHGTMDSADWSRIETSWARKLRGGSGRRVTYLIFQAI